jgi:hypothetical protein
MTQTHIYYPISPRPIPNPELEYIEARQQFSQFRARYSAADVLAMSKSQFSKWSRTYIALYEAVKKSRAALPRSAA